MNILENYGWNEEFADKLTALGKPPERVGRVISEIKNFYRLLTANGELHARAAGRMYYHSQGKEDLPTVGDWVVFKIEPGPEQLARISHILPRKSFFSRKMPGKTTRQQPVAANVDTVFIMTGLDDNYSVRRIERYLTLAWESGASPVVLLNKMDLCEQAEQRLLEVHEVAVGVPVRMISALHKNKLEELEEFLQPGQTVAMLGSSGVGKSTLLNSLIGSDVAKVKDLGTAGKGVHTTRTRELFILPSGAMLIDTPGMRELQLWDAEGGIADAFLDIEEFAKNCQFNDCSHKSEPNCAVLRAVAKGELDKKRLNNYQEMQDELALLDKKMDKKSMLERRSEVKQFSKLVKRVQNDKARLKGQK
jgi:ribosome biogenesis GTPase